MGQLEGQEHGFQGQLHLRTGQLLSKLPCTTSYERNSRRKKSQRSDSPFHSPEFFMIFSLQKVHRVLGLGHGRRVRFQVLKSFSPTPLRICPSTGIHRRRSALRMEVHNTNINSCYQFRVAVLLDKKNGRAPGAVSLKKVTDSAIKGGPLNSPQGRRQKAVSDRCQILAMSGRLTTRPMSPRKAPGRVSA